MGLSGCSSHSGRRTFVTNAARLVFKVSGSLRNVQQLAGHRSIEMMRLLPCWNGEMPTAATAWFGSERALRQIER
jgi:integrase